MNQNAEITLQRELDCGRSRSGANSINDVGQVTGWAMTSQEQRVAFLLTPLDTDGDGSADCWHEDGDGNGINDLMLNLGTLKSTTSSAGSAISSAGEVVGISNHAGRKPRRDAFLYSEGDMINLDELTGIGLESAKNIAPTAGYILAGGLLFAPAP